VQVDLNDRVALVTGAAKGIGLVIADTLAANGARVVYTDVDDAALAALATRSPKVTALRMDVGDQQQVDATVQRIVDSFGRIDILVNNAGVNTLHHRVPIDQFPREEWDRILHVDLTGLYLVSKAVAGTMRKQRFGRIINIASIAGLVPLRLQCAFVAAKAGVVNLSKAMALELGADGITVNVVAPGSILTEGTKALFYAEGGKFRDSVQQMLAHVPLGRPGTCEEVAAGVLYLAAPESSYVNGAVLCIDGGWTAGYAREF
jgi:3-oxoacyl-[acyl-carrier protein] reductase